MYVLISCLKVNMVETLQNLGISIMYDFIINSFLGNRFLIETNKGAPYFICSGTGLFCRLKYHCACKAGLNIFG